MFVLALEGRLVGPKPVCDSSVVVIGVLPGKLSIKLRLESTQIDTFGRKHAMREFTHCLVQEHAIRTMCSKCHYEVTRVHFERVRGNIKPTCTSLLRQISHASAD